jgi:hypothetical protein
MHSISRPAAIVAPAPTIVWWGFHRPLAPAPEERVLIDSEDRHRLCAIGVNLATRWERATREAKCMRRPLEMATDSLLLVCPQFGGQGDALHPHPLWDEIESAVPKSARASLLALARTRPSLGGPAPVRSIAPRRVPVAIRSWSLDHPIPEREVESPSSMRTLIECSLRWALQYFLHIHPHPGPAALGPLVYGKLAHFVFERLLSEHELEPARAKERAESIFDGNVASLVPELELPGRDFERSDVRRRISTAAHMLMRAIGGAKIRSIEQTFRMDDPLPLEGRPDLVLDDPPVVIDVKWQRLEDRIDALRRGTALQLAAYARLMQSGVHGLAFLTAYSGDLVVLDADLPNARRIEGPSAEEVWSAAHAAFVQRREELAQGRLVASGVPDERGELRPEESGIVDGRLELVAPCRYCEHAVLCGRAYQED